MKSHDKVTMLKAIAHQMSRKFIYQKGRKAQQALDESFAAPLR